MRELAGDARGVSEGAGVAALVVLTLLVTASVGVSVLFLDTGQGGPSAEFSYEHLEDVNTLLITHAGGDELPAGEIVIAGPGNNVTWATVASVEESTTVTEGDPVQIGDSNEYGREVRTGDDIRVVHAPDGGNRTVLSRWEPG